MSIKALYPSISPSLMLDFANTKALDPRVSFTRTTTATYYDGVTTAKAEENLLTYSQDFSNAAWVNQNTTETSGATAPDGTATAFTLDDGVATGGHDIGEVFSGTAGTTYTLSAFFKNVNRQYVILACSAGTNTWASAKFDLTAGTTGSTSASGAGWSTTSSSITSVGNSWYRCTITFVSGSTAGLTARLGMATDGTTFTAGQRGLESYTGTNATVEIWGAQVEQRSAVTAYTPTTTQPITNYIPVLLTAANNVARFDHNPTTGESLGLLVEEQRTNLVTYSDDFANAAWTKTRSSITSNTIVAPDGTLTGDKLVENTDNNTHRLVQSFSWVSGTTYTISVYAKRAERNFIFRADTTAFSANGNATFDLSVGTVAFASPFTSATITAVGNGWYRCTATATASVTASNTNLYMDLIDSTGNRTYTGDGYSGIYIWGAQLEAGAFPTSYIPTVAATVTRNADAASMTGTNFSSWYRADEGSFYSEVLFGVSAAVQGETSVLTVLQGSSTDNQVRINRQVTSGNFRLRYRANAADVGTPEVASAMPLNKVAAAYANGSQAIAANGTLGGTGSGTGAIPTVNNIVFGRFTDNSAVTILNGHIRKIAYYPKRLANAQLQALTS